MTRRIVILGAAGRDFHNFNVCFRNHPEDHVIAFTATQIPDIAGRKYPPELAGPLYPQGIPIVPEDQLEKLILEQSADLVVFSYSDVRHTHVMDLASRATAVGADFLLLAADSTMLESRVPVVSVCAVRTGCGKSPVSRRVVQALKEMGQRVVVVRHPMPYGDLARQRVQRFATMADLDKHECTIEEREEYEPHIAAATVVYAGVDYGAILAEAEREADVIVWDGGNNDFSFIKPDLQVTVVDPHRPGHELGYFPGEVNFRRADVIVINKMDTASKENFKLVLDNIQTYNPKAKVIKANSKIIVRDGEAIRGKRVLVIEDGPTLTHGEMRFGAGVVAAEKYGAKELVDPRPYAVGSIKETFKKYGHLDKVLPAMGYGDKQTRELNETINKVKCDLIVSATPIDLNRLIKTDKKLLAVGYELDEIGKPDLEEVLKKF